MASNLAPVNVKEIDGALSVYNAEIEKALAGKIDKDYFLLCAATAIKRDPAMFSPASRGSLMAAIFQSAKCNLPIGDGTQRACLVRYKNEVQFQFMFQGLIDLAYRSGQIKSISADLVFEGESFTWNGTNRPVEHQPPWDREEDLEKLQGAYAQAETLLGGWIAVRMGKKELDGIRKRSKSFQRGKGPWIDFPSEMYKKTALKRLCKHLPKSIFPQMVHSQLEQEDARDFKTAREAQITIENPAPSEDGKCLTPPESASPSEGREVKGGQVEALQRLLGKLPPDVSDKILFTAGIDGALSECKDGAKMQQAYEAAEEALVSI